MMRCGPAILLAIILASGQAAAQPAAGPYALRDIPLGITLGQFRLVPHPDAPMRGVAHILCSNDPTAAGLDALRLTPNLVEADVITCGFFMLRPGGNEDRRVAAPMAFFGEQVTPLFLFYRPAGAADYRLAQITFAMSNRHADNAILMFHRAFGNAPELQVSSVQTGFGPKLANITYVWNNGVSTLHLDTITVVLDQMSVVLSENRLWSSLSARLDTIARLNRIANLDAAKKAGGGSTKAAAAEASPGAKDASRKASEDGSGATDPAAGDRSRSGQEGEAAAPDGAQKAEDGGRAASPARSLPPPAALAGLGQSPSAPESAGAASASTPSYVEPPLNLPSQLGGFTLK